MTHLQPTRVASSEAGVLSRHKEYPRLAAGPKDEEDGYRPMWSVDWLGDHRHAEVMPSAGRSGMDKVPRASAVSIGSLMSEPCSTWVALRAVGFKFQMVDAEKSWPSGLLFNLVFFSFLFFQRLDRRATADSPMRYCWPFEVGKDLIRWRRKRFLLIPLIH
jgi:hypothetical protein